MSSSYSQSGDTIQHHMAVVTPMPWWVEAVSISLATIGLVWVVVVLIHAHAKVKPPGSLIMLVAILGYIVFWLSPVFLFSEGDESMPLQETIWAIDIIRHSFIVLFSYGFFRLCQNTWLSESA